MSSQPTLSSVLGFGKFLNPCCGPPRFLHRYILSASNGAFCRQSRPRRFRLVSDLVSGRAPLKWHVWNLLERHPFCQTRQVIIGLSIENFDRNSSFTVHDNHNCQKKKLKRKKDNHDCQKKEKKRKKGNHNCPIATIMVPEQ